MGGLLVLACVLAPLHAAGIRQLEVLPHLGTDLVFAGWRSEGVPPAQMEVHLELGDTVEGATLRITPDVPKARYRVQVQFETSLSIGNEGPHVDLVDWKHCTSAWLPAREVDGAAFVLPEATERQRTCFPEYTRAELRDGLRASFASDGSDTPGRVESWMPKRRADPAGTMPSPYVGVSRIRVRVQVQRGAAWDTLSVVTFLPPMGC